MFTENTFATRRLRDLVIAPRSGWWRYGPLVVWMAVIFFASTDTMSASNTSGVSLRVLSWLSGLPPDSERLHFWHVLVRKGGHFAEYAVLAALAVRAFATSPGAGLRRHAALAAFVLVAAYAFLDEYHQSFVPSRGASVYDSLLDIAGGTAALLVWVLFFARRRVQSAKNSL